MLNYFEKISESKKSCFLTFFFFEVPEGYITFKRRVLTNPPNWENSQKLLCKLVVEENGTIEESNGMIQVDFANKKIGGGVLGRGCVQEEIR